MNLLFPLAAFAIAALASISRAEPSDRVLFLTKSSGFVHAVVKRPDPNTLSLAEKKLTEAAAGHFAVDATQDCATITAENLKKYRAVVFYTTGELPIDETNRQALIDYVRGGGGFAGIHCATDTFYKFPAYGEMIGGYFDGHPWHQKVRIKVEDTKHPATAHLGGSFETNDEIYQFKDWSREKVHVLLSLDPASVEIAKGKRDDHDYANAWTREFGKGRVFYTALGHGPENWNDERFLKHIVAGIEWTFGAR